MNIGVFPGKDKWKIQSRNKWADGGGVTSGNPNPGDTNLCDSVRESYSPSLLLSIALVWEQ